MSLRYSLDSNILSIWFSGNFVNYSSMDEYDDFLNKIQFESLEKIIINGENLEKWDSTFVVMIYKICQQNKTIEMSTLPNGVKKLLKLAFYTSKINSESNKQTLNIIEIIGNNTINKYNIFKRGFGFLISVFKSLWRFFSGNAIMRKVDFLFAVEESGYKALPIVCLISFMIGLILAFVGAVQLKVFGAQIYVASLVSIGMVRIMGPAMAGIIMAGRT
jgi:phospholipid/cholesterol/gamma-HCH transport system permease protein